MKLETKDSLATSIWPQAIYRRVTSALVHGLLSLLLLLALSTAVHAQFIYMTVGGTITITR